MAESPEIPETQQRLHVLRRALDSGAAGQVRRLLTNLHPAEIDERLFADIPLERRLGLPDPLLLGCTPVPELSAHAFLYKRSQPDAQRETIGGQVIDLPATPESTKEN